MSHPPYSLSFSSILSSFCSLHSSRVGLPGDPWTSQAYSILKILYFPFLWLEGSSPSQWHSSLPTFRSLLICHFLSESFSDHPIWNYSSLPCWIFFPFGSFVSLAFITIYMYAKHILFIFISSHWNLRSIRMRIFALFTAGALALKTVRIQ